MFCSVSWHRAPVAQDWFDPRVGQYSLRSLMAVNATRFVPSLTAVYGFDDGNVRKQPMDWKEYCAEYW